MSLPEIEPRSDETLESFASRVQRAFLAAGVRLEELEPFAASSEPAQWCKFFQGRVKDRECVVIVAVSEWTEGILIAVLNLLLHIRTDPDPPGPPPLFRFYSTKPVPVVLRGLFGDSAASEFECRAALVAKFGNELGPASALQLGAVAIHLLRECFGARTSFFDADGDLRIAACVTESLKASSFPDGASPLNSLLVLGFLYGELLRIRLAPPSRWTVLKNVGPWPVLVFGPEPAPAGGPGVPQVVFSPIHTLLSLHKDGSRTLLREAREALESACRAKLG